ncbi:MAG: trypsin-like peptidase domain-containing protein [Candidatus Heteroscillospira sp.]|jgi:serine protease Do
MYDPNENLNHDESFDESAVSDSVAEHVEKQLEHMEPDHDPSYADAGYILSDEAPTTPRRYYTPPEREEKPKPEKSDRPRKKSGAFGKVMAGVLAGLLMGSAIGVGVMGMINPKEAPEADVPPAVTAAPTPTPMLTVSSGSSDEKSATDIYSIATSQVVGIRTEITGYNIWGQPTTNAVSGTGFIVSENGYIITNHHVIEDAYEGGYDVNVILYNGDSYVAEIVGFENSDSDIAVLKIDATGLTPAAIGDSSELAVGETVYAVGNPLGELTYTMTRGMVSALDREITTASYDQYGNTVTSTTNMFQIDAAVNSGNSGGPVYNSRGEVVGVVTAKSSETGTEGLGFAIPINDAIDIANDLITQGYVSGKPYMGITVQTMPQNVSSYYGVPTGAYVYYIESGSCAEKAGLQLGDIITSMDDHTITGTSDLMAAKKNYSAGDIVQLTVFRDSQSITLSLTFDEAHPTTETQSSSNSSDSNPFFTGNGAKNY